MPRLKEFNYLATQNNWRSSVGGLSQWIPVSNISGTRNSRFTYGASLSLWNCWLRTLVETGSTGFVFDPLVVMLTASRLRKAFVVAGGLLYGEGEEIFAPAFQAGDGDPFLGWCEVQNSVVCWSS